MENLKPKNSPNHRLDKEEIRKLVRKISVQYNQKMVLEEEIRKNIALLNDNIGENYDIRHLLIDAKYDFIMELSESSSFEKVASARIKFIEAEIRKGTYSGRPNLDTAINYYNKVKSCPLGKKSVATSFATWEAALNDWLDRNKSDATAKTRSGYEMAFRRTQSFASDVAAISLRNSK